MKTVCLVSSVFSAGIDSFLLRYDDSPGPEGEKGEQGDNSGAEQHLSTSSHSE